MIILLRTSLCVKTKKEKKILRHGEKIVLMNAYIFGLYYDFYLFFIIYPLLFISLRLKAQTAAGRWCGSTRSSAVDAHCEALNTIFSSCFCTKTCLPSLHPLQARWFWTARPSLLPRSWWPAGLSPSPPLKSILRWTRRTLPSEWSTQR